VVGEIKVSLGKDPGGKANEYVVLKEGERYPTDPIILEERRRREEDNP
jgi:hypothetical protein